jgi:2-amino-4-hydroxy-6-hydroxymethyldihydropteridine diphosphokinase
VPTAFIAFGGNIGEVGENLRRALEAIASLPTTRVRLVSSLYRTAPVGVSDQPDFVNGAAGLETDLKPDALLAELLKIEGSLGRTRERKWGPRTVDLDVLLWDSEVLSSPSLEVPHPRMHERGFVLVPLAEIASQVVHPILGRTIRELRDALGPTPDVELLGRPSWIEALEREGP